MGLTTDPEEARNSSIDPLTGQQRTYVVLSEEERAKGYVEPVRTSYKHVGIRPTYLLRELTEKEKATYHGLGYIKFELYLEGGAALGRFWTQAMLDSGCGTVTTMALPIAQTYAAQPEYYGATFCGGCTRHIAVEEFVWVENGRATDQRVGTRASR